MENEGPGMYVYSLNHELFTMILGGVRPFLPLRDSLAGVYIARHWEKGALPSSPGISRLIEEATAMPEAGGGGGVRKGNASVNS